VLCGEAKNINFIVFGLTLSGLEPMIYRTRGEQANHYISDAVDRDLTLINKIKCGWIRILDMKK
jgi:hypothetical protein